MSQVVVSPKAKSDLSDIWDYTLAEWGIDQAEKSVRELWAAMQDQVLHPATSVDISDVRKGYRKIRSGSHVIFFKLTDDGIDVVRILHQRMDFERHL
ncbi:MAG: type II toxin-antitoxin system RelE/ParE family toxin [Desulfuromonadales bacterium]|nr:type II toxin-antitoxin system RelE/ParE family toxin [Desulfuromonadales bacterium]MBN2791464.1 type II toxin-antitoxin system RelE/ParE family toxin [Desulfuromonadales bacterium]